MEARVKQLTIYQLTSTMNVCEFLQLKKKHACFHEGYVYIWNKSYENKDGCIMEYFHCQNKYLTIYFLLNFKKNTYLLKGKH